MIIFSINIFFNQYFLYLINLKFFRNLEIQLFFFLSLYSWNLLYASYNKFSQQHFQSNTIFLTINYRYLLNALLFYFSLISLATTEPLNCVGAVQMVCHKLNKLIIKNNIYRIIKLLPSYAIWFRRYSF